jgi:hypothetical protein
VVHGIICLEHVSDSASWWRLKAANPAATAVVQRTDAATANFPDAPLLSAPGTRHAFITSAPADQLPVHERTAKPQHLASTVPVSDCKMATRLLVHVARRELSE